MQTWKDSVLYIKEALFHTQLHYLYILYTPVGHNALRTNISTMFHNQPNRLRYS